MTHVFRPTEEARMSAYVVVNVKVHDPEPYAQYRALAPASIAVYGGRYIARGGATEVKEGDWRPERLVLLEFPDVAAARAWWDSPEYAPAKALRQSCAEAQLVITEGV
jgi:uncharacterized protein (DUF1330 family)